jgi:hypothetical protein
MALVSGFRKGIGRRNSYGVVLSILACILWKRRAGKEHEEELQFHLSIRERLNVEQGMAPREARLRFGNLSLWAERMSEIDLLFPQTVVQDLRYGVRMQ